MNITLAVCPCKFNLRVPDFTSHTASVLSSEHDNIDEPEGENSHRLTLINSKHEIHVILTVDVCPVNVMMGVSDTFQFHIRSVLSALPVSMSVSSDEKRQHQI